MAELGYEMQVDAVFAAAYVETTLGAYQPKATDAVLTSPPPPAADRLVVVEVDGLFWVGAGYSYPRGRATASPAPRFPASGPLLRKGLATGVVVVFDMTQGREIGRRILEDPTLLQTPRPSGHYGAALRPFGTPIPILIG